MIRISGFCFLFAILISAVSSRTEVCADEPAVAMQRERIQFNSSMDDSIQEAILIAPSSGNQLHKPVPLVVSPSFLERGFIAA